MYAAHSGKNPIREPLTVVSNVPCRLQEIAMSLVTFFVIFMSIFIMVPRHVSILRNTLCRVVFFPQVARLHVACRF